MGSKMLFFIGTLVGSTIGGYIPTLFGVSVFSFWSLLGNALGGIVAIISIYWFTNAYL